MPKTLLMLIVALPLVYGLTPAEDAWADSWTETFATGVGRLDQTHGNGNSRFAWNEAHQRIDGSFMRYVHTDPNATIDRRYAALDQEFDAHSSILEFSAVFTPISSPGGGVAAAQVGFLYTDPNILGSFLAFRFNGNSIGISIHGSTDAGNPIGEADGFLPYTFGQPYFISALLNGRNHLFTIDVFEGTDSDGTYVGSLSSTLDPDIPLTLSALGLKNPGTCGGPGGGVGCEFLGDIDEISLITSQVVPPGDANFDGIVNALDLSILASHWDEIDNVWSEGDFSDDGRVNGVDLSILAANWHATGAGHGVSFNDAVIARSFGGIPEPSSMLLLGVGCLSTLWRRDKKKAG